jgi:hypothetical protein
MNTTRYGKFNLVVDFGGKVEFFYRLVAVDLEAALADVVAAYGDCTVVQWGSA